MKKRIFALLLAILVLLTTLTACRARDAVRETQSPTPAATSTATPTVTATATPMPTPEPTPEVIPSDVVVNEAMADNQNLCLGHMLDWVELYNREETPVNLDYYCLTDDLAAPNAMSLAGLEIPADGYLTITLDEKAPFHLSANGETIYLTCQGKTISQLTFPAVAGGMTYSQKGICQYPTPGYANTKEGYFSYLEDRELPALAITEVLSSNSKYLPVKGTYYDLVEVKNTSDTLVRLSDYTFSDKPSEPERFSFPDVTLAPGEYYVIYCSGDTALGENHTSFKISASGETLCLFKDGGVVDSLTVPADVKENESYGRDGKYPVYFLTPTLGSNNPTGYLHNVAVPSASVPSGLYAQPVTLGLSGAGTIYYTLDGSRPTTDSPVYTEPLVIDGVTTVRTFCVDGQRSSALTAYTYVIGQTHDLPVVTVSIPQESLTGEQGVLNHIDKNYEYEGVLTLIEGGREQFSVPFGFRLHGNDSRKGDKQNFQLRFRSEYGVGKLQYPLFENRQINEYNSLLLKGGSEDWNRSMMRDELATAIVDGTTNLYAQAIKPVVLYLGGEYWGVYYLREKFSDDYVSSHLGVSEDSVDLLNSTYGSVEAGSSKAYQALLSYVKRHDMTLPESYAYLTEQIDVTSLMDWYICRSYMGDKDLANIRRFHSTEGDGKWRWMYYDLDWGFHHTTDKALTSILNNKIGEQTLILAVLQSTEGRDTFLRRYGELLNTILNERYITGVIDSLTTAIQSEMPRDRARWGRSLSGWNNAVNKLRDYVRDGVRTKRVLADVQVYFSLTEEEMQAYFGPVLSGLG